MASASDALRFPDFCDGDTYPSLPKTPFPGVAPVPTIRVHKDQQYHEGIDMMDMNPAVKGKAPTHVCLDYGDNGTLGIDQGRPKSGGARQPVDQSYGYAIPRRSKRRGK